ncbi:MAG: type I glutamate--ammonia ligase, partial [Clostridia bacterium]|nr:type I glutamate--ammonia ligase [Clostridia bacterium]
DGIEKGMTPPPEITENIFAMDAQTRAAKGIDSLPGTLHEAIECLTADKVICEALGEHVLSQYVEGKRKEWDAYRTHVSSWEIERYLVMY